jgi:hypothetical protein
MQLIRRKADIKNRTRSMIEALRSHLFSIGIEKREEIISPPFNT